MNPETLRQARLARDHRFDGIFFVAVSTTGIYCRPVCPAPPPDAASVRTGVRQWSADGGTGHLARPQGNRTLDRSLRENARAQ